MNHDCTNLKKNNIGIC